MAYTTIDNPLQFFNTVLYTGTGSSTNVTGVGFNPDWVWIKCRSHGTTDHVLFDTVRGAGQRIVSNSNGAEETQTGIMSGFVTDGVTVGTGGASNGSSRTYAMWNWLAGGTAPAITYSVKVVSDSGNKYRFDDFGTSAVTLDLQEGGTYTFDQSDSSNSGHPLRFSTTSDGTHGGGSEYTTGVTTTGTPGSSGAKTVITVSASAPTLYYYCSSHSGMGGQANTNSTFGSSNFSGSIQTKVSANTSSGFSIVSWTGTGSNTTIGHGIGSVPKFLVTKNRDSSTFGWYTYQASLGNSKNLYFHSTDSQVSGSSRWNDTTPTSSVFTVGTNSGTNGSSDDMIAYVFAEKKGFSKFGSYVGNGQSGINGTYVYTGFRPSWILLKNATSTGNWQLIDDKRLGYNSESRTFYINNQLEEQDETDADIFSNGFKLTSSGTDVNGTGDTYVYYAFAHSPFVNSNGVPTNAR
tara:strand:+ start:90 stop:1478 length:1389 start_codon:yes stop_codon:yes gene_type:complete